ncbi:MAG: pilus assembly protein PilP [Myxococcales bacterium]|nr:pilus assembly protein PilP [Myxococcales bacterium]
MKRSLIALSLITALVVAACSSKGPSSGAPGAGSAAPAVAAPVGSAAADGGLGPPKIDFQEAEFAENEKSRDPFRSFANMFVQEARGKVKSQREVLLDQYTVDELKLIGIVTGIDPAKAMLVDPTGKGHVVQRGQFVGRAEVVQASTTTARAYEINWRVDRIRDGDVVLIREDPQNPDVPSATKVIPLRPEGSVVNEK